MPGTHRRLRTEEEKRANERKPPDAVPVDTAAPPSEQHGPIDGAWDVDPPSTKRVYLKGVCDERLSEEERKGGRC